MKYVTTITSYLDSFFKELLDVKEIEFIQEDNVEYLLWDELINYINDNKDKEPDLYALLADLYYNGIHFEEDYQKARELFDKGIALNSTFCMYRKARLLVNSLNFEYKEALELLKKASEKNFAPAINNLGWMYSKGLGISCIDNKTAIQLFKKAAELGSVSAMANYGYNIIKEDLNEGLKMITKSANLGNISAQNTLGMYYYNGYYVKKDYKIAYEWFCKAASNESDFAINKLAEMYKEGYYVPQDYKKAILYYKIAIKYGNTHSKRELATLLNSFKDV